MKDDNHPKKMKRAAYEKELLRLQAKLCGLQDWVTATGQRIILILEGRTQRGRAGPSRRSPSA